MKSYNRIDDLRADLISGEITCHQLVEFYLGNIEKYAHLNIFLEVWAKEALDRAAEVDQKIQSGQFGKLAGVVVAIKDVLCYKNHKVSASSKILEGFESTFTATAVQRLLDEDAIIIGRTNCDEFAMGASNENSAYGPVKNGINDKLVPGGSSGGSAVAVQMNCCHISLGTDTGGSIRQPAAFTGIYGFKPTYGSISRWGLLAYASSFDQIGPFAHSIDDVAQITQIMSGRDEHDASMKQFSGYEWDTLVASNSSLKISVLQEATSHSALHGEVKSNFNENIKKLQAAGHNIEYFSFPYLDVMVPAYYVLTTAEASSNLSRYNGLLYGYRSNSVSDLESTFVKSRSEGFGEEVKRRIMLGTFVLSSDQYDAYYSKAQKVRRLITEKTLSILENSDVIVLPTTSTPAFLLGEKSADPVAMYLADLFTVQANLAGVPAISIPCGKTNDGLPLGLQIMSNKFQDMELLKYAKEIEKVL